MLPRAARIRKDREFKALFAKGRSYRGDLVVVYVLSTPGEAVRFGFTTARKIGTAVERNRVKRLLRETGRRLLPRMRPGTDILILARRRAAGASLVELAAEVERLLGKSGTLVDEEKQGT